MAYKSSNKYEHYNIHGDLVKNLGERIFDTEELLSRAYEGKPSSYKTARSWVISLRNKIKALGLNYKTVKMEIINLYLDISYKISENNDFEQATEYLWRAFEEVQLIYKNNKLLFPQKAKSMSFKDYATNEIG